MNDTVKIKRMKHDYIDNKEFTRAVLAHQEKLKENPKEPCPDYIAVNIFLIAQNLYKSAKYTSISDFVKEKAELLAYETAMRSLFKNFDGTRENPNAFAYVSSIALTSLLQCFNSEKKTSEAIKELTQTCFENGLNYSTIEGDSPTNYSGSLSSSKTIINEILQDNKDCTFFDENFSKTFENVDSDGVEVKQRNKKGVLKCQQDNNNKRNISNEEK